MMFSYTLPGKLGRPEKHKTDNNAIIIIGANGAGKSKLGAWIEQQDMENVHRIGGQRSLNFSENIELKSYSQAEDTVWYGDPSITGSLKDNKYSRWSHGKGLTTTLLTDFEAALSALLALTNNDNARYVAECRRAELARENKPQTRLTPVEKLFSIWGSVFPQRKLKVDDAKFITFLKNDGRNIEYSSTQMSDGERAVLYLAAQVLCMPPNKTLIIDEPELHLHASIMNRLWVALESARQDCLFIYITHDTNFAAMHSHAEKFWVQEYDGKKWIIEKVENDTLPEELLLSILGNRNDVLFVEGTSNSYDTQLYSQIYSGYHIIPCGSCSQVIARTKTFNGNPMLHHCKVYGIIDRDYRSEYEIGRYKEDNIYVLDVAEVENLFLVEELVRLIAKNQGLDDDNAFETVKNEIIHTSFERRIEHQICQCVVERLKYQLSTTDISNRNETAARECLANLITSLDYETIKNEEEAKFRAALSNDDYAAVIKVFNDKNISSGIEQVLGLRPKEYKKLVLRLLGGNMREQIIDAVTPYLPPEIPR